MLPAGCGVIIHSRTWPQPKAFERVARRGNISPREMFRTFNMGIGMVLIAEKKQIGKIQKILNRFTISSWDMGEVVSGKGVEIQ